MVPLHRLPALLEHLQWRRQLKPHYFHAISAHDMASLLLETHVLLSLFSSAPCSHALAPLGLLPSSTLIYSSFNPYFPSIGSQRRRGRASASVRPKFVSSAKRSSSALFSFALYIFMRTPPLKPRCTHINRIPFIGSLKSQSFSLYNLFQLFRFLDASLAVDFLGIVYPDAIHVDLLSHF